MSEPIPTTAAEILDRLEVWGQKLGLTATRRLLAALGDPQLAVPAALVAGTNGKGSTSAALASILSAAGYRCGLYTSPHLEDVEERIRIDGEAITSSELGALLCRVLDAAGATTPTYFESLTAAAWLHFAERRVNAAVFEVGLGGRLDATNVSEPIVSVITQVARDHAQQLGWTLTSIAGEKAGVMRSGRACFAADGPPEVMSELRRCAAATGARLVDTAPDRAFEAEPGRQAPLVGSHQLANLTLAIRAAREFAAVTGGRLDADAERRGIDAVCWPGRLEWVAIELHGRARRVLFDAAHNPAGAAALRSHLDRTGLRYDLLYGALADKQPELCLPRVAERAERIVLTTPDHRRAMPAAALRSVIAEREVVVADDAATALDRCLAELNRPLLVTGSLYLLGEVRSALRHRCGVPPPARDVVTGYNGKRSQV